MLEAKVELISEGRRIALRQCLLGANTESMCVTFNHHPRSPPKFAILS
jgi:hypothetical protein